MSTNKLESETNTTSLSFQIELVDDLLARMSLAEKIGQMTQVEKGSIMPEEVTEHYIGSVLSGGGGNPSPNTPATWAEMVRSYREAALKTPLAIPLLYGVDGVHGHNNVYGATIFPHNIGLGATRDPELIRRIAQATALELRATGVNWDFAPMVGVPQDVRWGRTYEAFSEDTDLVTRLGLAFFEGLTQEPHYRILESFKHYVADGGTNWGSSNTLEWLWRERPEIDRSYWIDQGDAEIDENTLRQLHLKPYIAAIEAGALNIMVSFNSWNGLKMHGHHYLLSEVLKGELGFDGFLISDWMAINQLDTDNYTCVVQSINAGLDMIMVPFQYKEFVGDATRAVEGGDIPEERIDDAVRRILAVKARLGLFDDPTVGDTPPIEVIGCVEHRGVAREAVRKSAVLLKNEAETLPLGPDRISLIVAGQAADNIGIQCGGWTIEWQGTPGEITKGTTLLEALKTTLPSTVSVRFFPQGEFPDAMQPAQVGIVVAGELPYAEGMGDAPDLHLSEEDRSLIYRLRDRCERLVLVLYSGRPLIITDELELCDAVVAAWLPGTEGMGLTDILLGTFPFEGKLPFSWPRNMEQVPLASLKAGAEAPLFPFGYGLTTSPW